MHGARLSGIFNLKKTTFINLDLIHTIKDKSSLFLGIEQADKIAEFMKK